MYPRGDDVTRVVTASAGQLWYSPRFLAGLCEMPHVTATDRLCFLCAQCCGRPVHDRQRLASDISSGDRSIAADIYTLLLPAVSVTPS